MPVEPPSFGNGVVRPLKLGLRISCVMVDPMHAIDLGVAPLLHGSALHLLVYHPTLSPIAGATVGARAQVVGDMVQNTCTVRPQMEN